MVSRIPLANARGSDSEPRPSGSGSPSQRIQVDFLEGHRAWSATYDTAPNPLLALESRVVSGLLGDLRGARFADIACGTGRWMLEARRRGARVVGIDLCREMLLHAARQPEAEGLLAEADILRLPLAAACAGTVMCAFSAGYLQDLDAALAEMARVARPGGRVILTDVHPDGLRRGWSRSFRADGRVYELENYPHSEDAWRQAGRRARLALEQWLEPRFEDPERNVFRLAGKEELFDAARQGPAVLVAVWRRP